MANHGSENNYEVVSTIYLMFENGTMLHHQDISTQAASDVKIFRPQGSNDSYLIFANMKDNNGDTAILSKVRYSLLLCFCLVLQYLGLGCFPLSLVDGLYCIVVLETINFTTIGHKIRAQTF